MGHPVCLERLARDTGCLNGCMHEEYIAKNRTEKWHKPLKDRAKIGKCGYPEKSSWVRRRGRDGGRARAPRPSDVAMDFQRNVGRSDPKAENGPKK